MEWNTLHALREFGDEWLFYDNEDGTFRGSNYESDEEIRTRLEKEANQRAEKERKKLLEVLAQVRD